MEDRCLDRPNFWLECGRHWGAEGMKIGRLLNSATRKVGDECLEGCREGGHNYIANDSHKSLIVPGRARVFPGKTITLSVTSSG